VFTAVSFGDFVALSPMYHSDLPPFSSASSEVSWIAWVLLFKDPTPPQVLCWLSALTCQMNWLSELFLA